MLLFLLIAFAATFLLSRLAFWLMRGWNGGALRFLVAHLASLALCWAWFAFGSADGRIYIAGGWLFVLPQGLWTILDFGMGKADREPLDPS